MRGQKKLRILLVEDQVKTIEKLARIVNAGISDLRVAITKSEEAAIEQVRLVTPDVMIVDLDLRTGSALNVLRAAKGLERPPLTVALLNDSGTETRSRAIDIGADYFLENGETEALTAILRCVVQRQEESRSDNPAPENDEDIGTMLPDVDEKGDPGDTKRLH